MRQLPYQGSEVPLYKPVDVLVHLTPTTHIEFSFDKSAPADLVPQEFRRILRDQEVSQPYTDGLLVQTNMRLLVLKRISESFYTPIFSIPYGFIQDWEKTGGQRSSKDERYGLTLRLKTPMQLFIQLSKAQNQRKTVAQLLEQYVQPCSKKDDLPIRQELQLSNGWKRYDPVLEFQRLGAECRFESKALQVDLPRIKRLQKHFPGIAQTDQMRYVFQNPQIIGSVDADGIAGAGVDFALHDKVECNTIEQSTTESEREDPEFSLVLENITYAVCDTYPAIVCIPARLTTQQIRQAAERRNFNRFPVLSWFQPDAPCLFRAAAPKPGQQKRQMDKDVIDAFSSARYPFTVIVDADGVAQKESGGHEIEYSSVDETIYCGFDFHAMRQSGEAFREALLADFNRIQLYDFQRLAQKSCKGLTDDMVRRKNPELLQVFKKQELVNFNQQAKRVEKVEPVLDENESELPVVKVPSMPRYASDDDAGSSLQIEQQINALPQSAQQSNVFPMLDAEPGQWISYIRQLIRAGNHVAKLIRGGHNVLVQCSTGVDFSACIVSTAQLFLDRFYRTVAGFASLISKEFIAMGHPFGSRYGNYGYDGKEQNWTFPMFLEAVSHLVKYNKLKFEFDEDFLLFLMHQLYSRETGTFIFDCEVDRMLCQVQQTTNSAFDALEERWKRREIQPASLQAFSMACEPWGSWWAQHFCEQ